MPTYVYRCRECDHYFEVVQGFSDDPVTACERCGGEVTRVLFAPAIHFKGSGFHNTDYGTKRRPVGGDGSPDGVPATAGDGAANGASAAPANGAGASKTVGLDKV